MEGQVMKMPPVRTRLPGDRMLDQLAGGTSWRKVVARGTVALCLAVWGFCMTYFGGLPWWTPVAVVGLAALLYFAVDWISRNWNG
jgi:hypothetical protein